MGEVLPPSGQELSDSFVAVFGQNKEDLTKCQLLTVSRHEYKTLAEERCEVNVNFCNTVVDSQRVEALPERGVPQQFIECAVQMPGQGQALFATRWKLDNLTMMVLTSSATSQAKNAMFGCPTMGASKKTFIQQL